MKNLFIVLLCIISFCANAKIIDDTKEMYNSAKTSIVNTITDVDTSSVTKAIYSDVKTVVKAIATQLKTTSEKVMEILAKKYFLEGVFNLIVFTVLTVLLIVFYIKAYKFYLHLIQDKEIIIPVSIISLILNFAIILCCGEIYFNLLKTGILYTFNPEYYVITDIFNFVKSFRK